MTSNHAGIPNFVTSKMEIKCLKNEMKPCFCFR
jgi:hypothetical protein